MPTDVRSRVTLALVKPEAIDPTIPKVITQHALLRLPSGKIVKVFEWAQEEFFNPVDVGVTFSVILFLDAGDGNMEPLNVERQSLSQANHIANVEGRVVRVEPYVYQRYQVYIDVGDCVIKVYTNRELKEGDFIRAEGRLEVRDKQKTSEGSRNHPDS